MKWKFKRGYLKMRSIVSYEPVSSFTLIKYGKSYLVRVSNLRPDVKSIYFQFDSGSSVTLIGLNTICDNDEERKNILKDIILEKVAQKGVSEHTITAQTVTRERITLYPCKCEGISIFNTIPKTLYFYVFLGDVNKPLLGFDYIDDCTCHHTVGGDFVILTVADDAGKRFYPEKILDFGEILEEYEKRIQEEDEKNTVRESVDNAIEEYTSGKPGIPKTMDELEAMEEE